MAVKHHVTELVHLRDLASLVMSIKMFQNNPQGLPVGQSLITLCESIVQYLARFQAPRDPGELAIFIENVIGVRNFLKELCDTSKASAGNIVASCLKQLYSILSNKDIEPCAPVSVVLHLVEPPFIPQAVSWLLSENPCEDDLKRSLKILAGWLRYCNYTPSLSEWVICFLRGLQDQQRWGILLGACLPVVEDLITSLIVPAIRPSVKPALLHMIMSVKHTPVLLQKIMPRIVPILQQLCREGTEESHKVKQELIDIIMALFDLFPEEKEKQGETIYCLTLMGPSVGYNRVLDVLPFSAPHVPTGIRVGLSNLGNTCYMNSVLQALFMTKQFFREVLTSSHKCQILEQLADLFALLKHSSRPQLSPRGMLQRARPPGFTQGHQHDSSEFLSHLLDVLHEEEKTVIIFNQQKSLDSQNSGSIKRWPTEEDLSNEIIPTDSLQIDNLDENGVEVITETIITNSKYKTESQINETAPKENKVSELSCDRVTPYSTNNVKVAKASIGSSGDCTLEKIDIAKETIVQKCFGGQMTTSLQCLKCGFRSDNGDSFRDMQLAFPDNYVTAESYTVQRLLDFYLSKELLQGDNRYSCEQCQTLCEAERSIDILAAPKVLLLTLKHFKYDPLLHTRTKLLHKVSFHDSLSVSVNVTSIDRRVDYKVFYMLYAAVVHSGVNMDCGHYYTYAMDKPNTWYKFNDSLVTESSIDELHSLNPPNSPYILFYKQIGQMHVAPCVNEEEVFVNNTDYMENDNCLNDENNMDMLHNVDENCIEMDNEMLDNCNLDWKTSEIKLDSNIVLVDEMDNDFDFNHLPNHLQALILRDNSLYEDEMRSNFKKIKNPKQNNYFQNRRDREDDDPPNNCGGNSGIVSDANRFIY